MHLVHRLYATQRIRHITMRFLDCGEKAIVDVETPGGDPPPSVEMRPVPHHPSIDGARSGAARSEEAI
jgi:hypothetical protein